MTCLSCGTELICRIKDYGGGYEAKPQWQNEDGSAHYSTKDGKDFTCNVPKDDESQEVHTTDTTANTSAGTFTCSVDGTSSATTFTDSTTTLSPQLPEMDSITTKYVDEQITLIRQIEARVFSILGTDANVAKVGMYVKLILEGINRK